MKVGQLLDMLPAVVRNYSFPISYADNAAAPPFASSASSNNNNSTAGSQRRQVPGVFGQSANTTQQNISAARLATAFRKSRKLPFDLTPDEFEGDNLANYICNFCRWGANTAVPHYFNEDLEGRDNNKCLGATTKIQYIGKHLDDLRRNVVPNHPDFEGLKEVEHPDWWTQLRKGYTDEANRFQAKNPGDEVFGHPDVIPLYRDLRHRRGGKDDWPDDPRVMVDVRMILLSLWKKKETGDQNMEFSNLVYDTFDACGRGGEVKFQNYNDWRFDHLLQVVDAPWQETKILDCYSRAGLSDDDWVFDFYVQKGAFYMCEKGLYRTEEQVKKGFEHAVYPSLHDRSDNGVAKLIGNILKKQVANKLGKDWEDLERVTSRGLRSGSISQLSMFPNISVFQATALTGHSIGNLRSYLDARNIVKALPAANAIHQNKSLYTESVLPTLQSIKAHPGGANEEVFKKLMSSMFTVNIEDFSPGGKHYIILVTCALSLIRHYRNIIKDCGAANVITRKLISHASTVNLSHLGNPYSKPAGCIETWCDLINADILKRQKIKEAEALKDDHKNSVIMGLMTSIATDVKEQKDQSAGLVDNLATARSTEIQLVDELEKCRTSLARLEAENASLRQQLHNSDEKMRRYKKMVEASILTPDKIGSSEEHLSPPVSKRPRLSCDKEEHDNHVETLSDVFDGEDLAAATTTAAAAASAPTTTAALAEQAAPAVVNVNPSSSSNAAHPIMVPTNSNVTATTASTATAPSSERDCPINWTNGAESASDKGKRFLNVLLDLCDAGLVEPGKKLKNTAIPQSILKNPSGMTHCLDVGDFCCDSVDIDLVATYKEQLVDNAQKVEAINAGVRIEDAIYRKVSEFQKVTRPEGSTKVSGRSFLGMARHIKEYRNRIKTATKESTRLLINIPLMEVEDLRRIERGEGREVDPSPSATVESQIQEEEEHVLQPADAAAVSAGEAGSAVLGARGRTAGGVQRSILGFAAPVIRRTAEGGGGEPSGNADGQVEGL